jgi:hypothetical protein
VPVDQFVLPEADELSRRLEAENDRGVLSMFRPAVAGLGGRSFTAQGFVLELTLVVAGFAQGDEGATGAGFTAMPLAIDALIDDADVRAEAHSFLRTSLDQ